MVCLYRCGIVIWAVLCPAILAADERLKDIACRSVHLAFGGAADGVSAFYNEVQVEQSSPGSFFMVCGWNTGYYGLQELANGKRLLIFSVWDAHQGDDPSAVEQKRRVELVEHDPDVRVGRFGGEGTGGQSFFDFDWKDGTRYQFITSCRVVGDRTQYSGHFYDPTQQSWRKLVTFSTITGGRPMRGLYSFIEDFKRDGRSAQQTRSAWFGTPWQLTLDNAWQPISQARFTADANPVENINAKADENRFFLATGGAIKNVDVRLRDTMTLSTPPSNPPALLKRIELPALEVPPGEGAR